MKLAIASALLLGACVTTETDEVAKVAPLDHVDYGSMVLTGVETSGHDVTDGAIDWPTELAIDPTGLATELCGSAATLPDSDVCSSLCDPRGFIARVNDTSHENPTTCTQHRCQLGDKLVNIEVCAPGDN